MDSHYTIDDVLQTASCFVQNIDELFEEHNGRGDLMEQLYFTKLKNMSKYEELEHSGQKLVKTEHKKLEDVRKSLEINKVYMESLKDNVGKLKAEKLQKENELVRLKSDVDKVRNKIQSMSDDREDIDRQKDIILTYKILTKTSFVHTTRKITGIVEKQRPTTFSFNPQEMSQDEIEEKLWKLVLEDKE